MGSLVLRIPEKDLVEAIEFLIKLGWEIDIIENSFDGLDCLVLTWYSQKGEKYVT